VRERHLRNRNTPMSSSPPRWPSFSFFCLSSSSRSFHRHFAVSVSQSLDACSMHVVLNTRRFSQRPSPCALLSQLSKQEDQ
jgi:hypothetical protein